ncbi:MAG: iron-containing redox enzyme family protein, partial [Actinomycetota bacterium]
MIELTQARGPLSGWVISQLRGSPGWAAAPTFEGLPRTETEVLASDDLHLALYLCYELAFGGIEGVDERWEWDPDLLSFRAALEAPFESAVRRRVATAPPVPVGTIDARLRAVLRMDSGPSLSRFLERTGTVDQYREFLVHRSAYQLREADPHSFGIPRLQGPAKAALVQIQADEYGGGDASWMHSALFARSMRA